MIIIRVQWPDYPHVYAVCVVRPRILYINSLAVKCSIVQLDYSS